MNQKTSQYLIGENRTTSNTALSILDHYNVNEQDLFRVYAGLVSLVEKNGVKIVMTDMSNMKEEHNGEEADHIETCTSDGEVVYLHDQLDDHGGILTRIYDVLHMGCGHIVQWGADQKSGLDWYGDKAWDIGSVFHLNATDEKLAQVSDYEMEASKIALTCLRKVLKETLLDTPADNIFQMYSDYVLSDNKYIINYYKTGVSTNFFDNWLFDLPLIETKKFPSFTPHKRMMMNIGLIRNDS